MRLHERFEWDAGKAESNLAAHRVMFVEAAAALADDFGDQFHLERFDEAHSGHEDRFITIASDPRDRAIVYVVVWTDREDDAGPVTRIISARLATSAERRLYAQEVES